MAIGLSKGQLSSTIASIFTATQSTYVKTILFHNTNTETETVIVSLVNNNGGSLGTSAESDNILSISLTTGNTFEFSPSYPLLLNSNNDSIQAISTTASKVNYIVSGELNA
jgi:hypothetical protein